MSSNSPRGIHVAIIMDGNGRWATARGQLRTAGHIAGARQVRKIVEAAPDCGIGTLTLYAFSADNWRRPSREVALLMRLFRRYLHSEVARCVTNGVRMKIIGRRDRIPAELKRAICNAEQATRDGRTLDLRIAVDYSARDAILRAARKMRHDIPRDTEQERCEFAHLLSDVDHGIGESRDVDLLIRTGGEQRLSDFLLWECAYAELLFVEKMWPDYTADDLGEALADFRGRNRRFGLAPEQVAS